MLVGAHKDTLAWTSCVNPRRITKPIGTTTTITQLLFSHERIITADDKGAILVFSPDGELHYRLKGHKLGVWCLVSTKTKLVSGSEDKTIRVWNLTTGLCTHVFRGHRGVVRCLEIAQPEAPMEPEPGLAPDEQPRLQPIRPLVVSGSRDSSVRVWMLPGLSESEYGRSHKDGPAPDPDPTANPYHLYHLTGHTGGVRCISANRKTVLSGSDDCTVRVYDIKANKLVYILQGHTAKITKVAIDPRLRMYYSTSMDGHLRLWDAKNGNCMAVCTQHQAGITFMFNTPWRIMTAGEDGLCLTWNSAAGKRLHRFHSGDGDFICDLQGDDYKILTVTEASAKMWNPQNADLVRTLFQCIGKEKLSHVAYELKQCALTSKDARGYNMLTIIDFRPPEELQLFDSDDEPHS